MDNSTVVLIVVVALGLFVITIFNQFIGYRNRAKNAFANIDVMLRKRHDLIPQIVNTVQGIMQHEKETLARITQLRKQIIDEPLNQDELMALNNELSNSMGKVFVAVEAYPALKSSENFLHLQRSMAEIEEQLSASRRSYNMAVTEFNTLLEKFPSNIIGKLFSFKRKVLFEATASEIANPKINANSNA